MLEKRKLLFTMRKTRGMRLLRVSKKRLKYPEIIAIGKCMKNKKTAFRSFYPLDFIPGGCPFFHFVARGGHLKSRDPPRNFLFLTPDVEDVRKI
jgi:hypothetical protein